jgi:hypothetical protein
MVGDPEVLRYITVDVLRRRSFMAISSIVIPFGFTFNVVREYGTILSA